MMEVGEIYVDLMLLIVDFFEIWLVEIKFFGNCLLCVYVLKFIFLFFIDYKWYNYIVLIII